MIRLKGTFHDIPIIFSTFPAGEEYCRFEVPSYCRKVTIIAAIDSSSEWMRLLAVFNVLNQRGNLFKHLVLSYVPGGRQDHPSRGTPGTIEQNAQIIGQIMRPDVITIVDPHSESTPELLQKHCKASIETVRSSELMVHEEIVNTIGWQNYWGTIAPDEGAVNRATLMHQAIVLHPLARTCEHLTRMWMNGLINYIIPQFNKHRDQETSNILQYTAPSFLPNPEGHYLIVDDICDGGKTPLLLGKAMKEKYPKAKLSTFFTYAIFSNPANLEELAGLYENIFTTDMFPSKCMNPKVRVFKFFG
jgi:ribose-phosphate pyrophosphokinase